MSEIKKCSMCPQTAIQMCHCQQGLYLCQDHIQPHLAQEGVQHHLEPFLHQISPQDIQKLKQIRQQLDDQLSLQIQQILRRKQQLLKPLLDQVQQLKRQYEQERKKIQEEEQEKIEVIEQILSQGGVTSIEQREKLENLFNSDDDIFQNELDRNFWNDWKERGFQSLDAQYYQEQQKYTPQEKYMREKEILMKEQYNRGQEQKFVVLDEELAEVVAEDSWNSDSEQENPPENYEFPFN